MQPVAIFFMCWDAAIGDYGGKATNGVGSTAEAEEINFVPWLPEPN
jgi:hypothetical protein